MAIGGFELQQGSDRSANVYGKDTLKVYDRVCDSNINGVGGVVIGIEDSVRLSAGAVYASLALSHTYGGYNCRMLVFGMIIARGLKTVFVGDYYYDY